MSGSVSSLYNPFFSHIYVEAAAYSYPLTGAVLAQFKNATVVPITHYKDVFNRPGSDFLAQKKSPKLILAVRRDKFLFPGAAVCDHFGHERFFYATQMMNCPYDCAYCYLRGMYPSAHIVAFVNTADYFNAAAAAQPAYISISYDADLLAMEGVFHFAAAWIELAAAHPALTVELRTKSAADIRRIAEKPADNVILSWTLSPAEDAARFEKSAPGLQNRLAAMKKAMDDGWKVRLCVDPIMLTEGWEERVSGMAEVIRSTIEVEKLYDVSVNGFRVSKTYYKRMRKMDPGSAVFALPIAEKDGVCAYIAEDERRIKAFVTERLGV